jgi:hypothetical protein
MNKLFSTAFSAALESKKHAIEHLERMVGKMVDNPQERQDPHCAVGFSSNLLLQPAAASR